MVYRLNWVKLGVGGGRGAEVLIMMLYLLKNFMTEKLKINFQIVVPRSASSFTVEMWFTLHT